MNKVIKRVRLNGLPNLSKYSTLSDILQVTGKNISFIQGNEDPYPIKIELNITNELKLEGSEDIAWQKIFLACNLQLRNSLITDYSPDTAPSTYFTNLSNRNVKIEHERDNETKITAHENVYVSDTWEIQ